MKSYHDIAGDGGSRILEQVQDHAARLAENLSRVKFVLAVASGKGGVGKSSVSAGLALAWARQGLSVGLLDADLHGSSVARLLGMTGLHLSVPPSSRPAPQLGPEGIRVFSMDFLQDPAGPVRWKNVPGGDEFVWRTTLEMSLLREFLTDVEWGRLDVLLLDLPPGGDRLANVAGLLEPGRLRVALVTSSSGLSQDIVEKSFRGAIQKKIPVLGLIENMKGYLCSQCGDVRPLFAGDATGLASRLGMAYLGGIPFDPEWSRLGDEGRLWETAAWHEPVQRAFENLGRTVIAGSEER